MIGIEDIRLLVLSFPEVSEEPHFEKTSFRIKKKIFATYNANENKLTVKLSAIDQDVFALAGDAIYPVPNKWGKQGWTTIEFKKVHKDLLADALRTAYCTVAPSKLAEIVRPSER